MKLWKVQLVMLLALLSWATRVQAEPKGADLKFVLYYPQVPPYMYAAANNKPTGVIPDLLNAFFQQQPYEVKYVYENRFRAELGLYSGEYDASVLAAAWTKQPEQLLF